MTGEHLVLAALFLMIVVVFFDDVVIGQFNNKGGDEIV